MSSRFAPKKESNRQKKAALMAEARKFGWKGKSFRKALKFERKLVREGR